MRASLLGSILAASCALSAALAVPAAPAAQADSIALVPAVQADSVVDAYGVGIHLPFLDTPYKDATAVANALSNLGVRHVRDDLYLNNPRQYSGIATVASRGIGFDLISGSPQNGPPEDYISTIATQLPAGAVESIEGTNEWDLFSGGGQGWEEQVRARQQALYAAAKANPATAKLPILAPALAWSWNYQLLGDLTPYADYANVHTYPGGQPPSSTIASTSAAAQKITKRPVITTETGYTNATSSLASHRPVPESVSGIYMPRVLLEHFNAGHRRVYSYELIDEFADPFNTNVEAQFGLLNRDLSPKPAYTAMRNLLSLLNDPGVAFAPKPLAVRVSGAPSDARYLLAQKRNGQYVLALWRNASIFDPAKQQNLSVTPSPVTVQLTRPTTISVYRPSTQATRTKRVVTATLPLTLDAAVTALTIG